MIAEQKLRSLAESYAAEHQLFVVDVVVRPDNAIEVEIDNAKGVNFDDCAALTRHIEANFDREVEDYELTVSSPGLGTPLKVMAQYQKLIEKPIEVLLKTGEKLTATLTAATVDGIDIVYTKRQLLEGKKRKQEVVITQTFLFADIKSVKAVV